MYIIIQYPLTFATNYYNNNIGKFQLHGFVLNPI